MAPRLIVTCCTRHTLKTSHEDLSKVNRGSTRRELHKHLKREGFPKFNREGFERTRRWCLTELSEIDIQEDVMTNQTISRTISRRRFWYPVIEFTRRRSPEEAILVDTLQGRTVKSRVDDNCNLNEDYSSRIIHRMNTRRSNTTHRVFSDSIQIHHLFTMCKAQCPSTFEHSKPYRTLTRLVNSRMLASPKPWGVTIPMSMVFRDRPNMWSMMINQSIVLTVIIIWSRSNQKRLITMCQWEMPR